MRPWCIHFGRERNAKKSENLMLIRSKNTPKSSKQYYLLGYLVFNFKNQPTKKRGEELEKLLPGIRTPSRTLWTTTNKLEAHEQTGGPRTNWRRGRLQTAATTRERCAVHMCASSVFSRRASPAHAQRKNCRYFST